ncbi:Membrane insertase YidC/Oxa/ALB C-terminal domain-containing protein [Plasmodiophora brassicae]|nr:hypothetical protein PBRA_003652 [Plasmodiophora brassicae]
MAAVDAVAAPTATATADGLMTFGDATTAVTQGSMAWYEWGAYGLQEVMNYGHTAMGLPWWASIVATTIGIRLLLAPLAVPQMRCASRLTILRPKIQSLQEKMRDRMVNGPPPSAEERVVMQNELWDVFRKYDVSPFKSLKFALLQMPVFLSFFLALRELGTRYPECKTGGALWFTDLASQDPYYALPVISALSFVATLEFGAEGDSMDPNVKKAFRLVPLIVVPLTFYLPQGVFLYWITNSLYGVVQTKLIRSEAARRFFNIPNPKAPNALAELEMHVGGTRDVQVKPDIIPNRPFYKSTR